MRHLPAFIALSATFGTLMALGACEPYSPYDSEQMTDHPIEAHPFVPVLPFETNEAGESVRVAQVAAGAQTGVALDQPIAFSHQRHAALLGMDCQYCHAIARRSIHAGPPPVEVCMGCHQHVRRVPGATEDSPQIARLVEHWEAGRPITWAKVHDLPDYVHFSHKRHVRAGVDCTECHGQVATQGEWPNGDPAQAEVMVREASLQMGWCLDCHASHPSIDENYGEEADARRAELKDCWTCHK
jgi:hypothetical protein